MCAQMLVVSICKCKQVATCVPVPYLHAVMLSLCHLPRQLSWAGLSSGQFTTMALLHACCTAAGQGATVVVDGDEVDGAAALDANADETAVQSQGKVSS